VFRLGIVETTTQRLLNPKKYKNYSLIVSQIVQELSAILIITINKLDNNNLVAKYPTDTFATSALLEI